VKAEALDLASELGAQQTVNPETTALPAEIDAITDEAGAEKLEHREIEGRAVITP